MIRLLVVEDHLSQVPGLAAALRTTPDDPEQLVVHDRVPTTLEDTLRLFDRLGSSPDALRAMPIDGVLVDDLLPRDRGSRRPERCAIELAIRLTALFDDRELPDDARPALVLHSADVESHPCNVRAFVTYGGRGALAKTTMPPEELRRRVRCLVNRDAVWEPPEPRLPHGYGSGDLSKYLREFEMGHATDAVTARRLRVEVETVQRTRNRFRNLFDLEESASDKRILEAALERGITWVPIEWEDLARRYGVRPAAGRPLWDN
jgi:hypothetical protein